MPFTPISENVAKTSLKNIQLIATDMDGTLTKNGKFTSDLFLALEKLAAAKIQVLVITGRSAGWVQAIKNYLPIVGAIAENGGLFYPIHSETPQFLISIPNITLHRQNLANIFQYLKSQFPLIEPSVDNQFRLTDWTFDIQNLSISELTKMADICQSKGYGFTYSTVQCHIKPLQQNKASGLCKIISEYFPNLTTEKVITVGDSPNDESLFEESKFPFSVGVANILEYANKINHQPVYVTSKKEAEGFCELAELILSIDQH
ncbi:HAD-superfamily hydrolase, subfamily IIB [Trichodesmium erythraeum IMS101]|uniref:HAD-superfamily hydrolase, subfamily IIB n=1 Tax=Trichodesmium erythraeum (strain IMS101) TaxID=203124 RepID=Q10XW2_TRIEI|nr:HAD family phosphatase [Trichodesmium erythraeum GBRTRLIN201]MDT9340579.1 Cof-type HAD-IIB family hydrolase [Trichodesmium erythraeum 21-75]